MEQSKSNRKITITLVIIAGIWTLVHIFAPFVHPIEGIADPFTEWLYYVSTFIPQLLLLFLLVDLYGKKKRKIVPRFIMRWFNSEKFWMYLFFSGFLLVFAFVIWTQVLGNYICYRGTMSTLGLLFLMAMWMLHKFKHIGVWQAAAIGMIGIGFAIGGWEIPYQAASYITKHAGWSHPLATSENFTIIMIEQIKYVAPLLIICPFYKIKTTKWTFLSFGMFALLWGMWYFAFDFWSVVTYSSEKQSLILNTPINWTAYQLAKAGQVAFILGILSLKRETEVKVKADYDWQGFSSWNLVRRFWKRKIAQRVWTLAQSLDKKTLDAGCGSSQIITHFNQVIGIDNNPEKIEFMKQNTGSNDTFKVMDLYNLEFEDNSFDLVLCLEVIEHLDNPDIAMAELSRVLSPNGQAIIATPDNSKLLWRITQPVYNLFGGYREQHSTLFTKNSLIVLATKHNLKLVHCEHIAGCDLICVFSKEGQL